MPKDTLAERLKNRETKRRNRSVDLIAELDAAEGGAASSNPNPPTKPKRKPKEKVGTGKASFDLDGAIAEINARVAATNDPTLKAKLLARIEALKANAL